MSTTAVTYTVRQEQARSLAGILRRRLPAGWDTDLGLDSAEDAAHIAGPLLGWSHPHIRQEIERFRRNTQLNFNLRQPV